MSTGGGNSGFESALDIVANAFTFGALGFKSDAKDDGLFGVTKGVSTETAIGGLKDITGATAAEQANADATARFEAEKAATDKARKDAQSVSAANQLNKSRSAASSRGGVSNPSTSGQSRFSNLGSDESDFLGL